MPSLAPSLAILRNEVNHRWPNRSKASDGWVGDAAHAARVSEHNPDSRGVVHALDITCEGIDAAAVVRACVRHPSVWYVVWDRTIRSRTHSFMPLPYGGADPHTGHVHVSLRVPYEQDTSAADALLAEKSTVPWLSTAEPIVGVLPGRLSLPIGQSGGSTKFPLPVGHIYGMKSRHRLLALLGRVHDGQGRAGEDQWIMRWQQRVGGLDLTGVFDRATVSRTKLVQSSNRLRVTGSVSAADWKHFGL